ncbi:TPA: hypothetical protein ACNH9H_001786 [Pseudomonas aeruginosa]|uniref:Uncharacterized protein n=1 Tax=Pseudomonas aeruginosa TaxID=287 RepID=A0A0P0A6J2_PSEAI|nr:MULTISPECIES: hypothetical protein [Pseudomonas]MED5477542.1 hypothetical protein [Pseudomonadota bacterium]SSU86475.1 Uncharacterised protein [Acinetobacter baumannii]ALI58742.1 hypothetical protein CCBH4851_00036 [Pseudomonas aeruginosa]AOX26861.1 hypothetical protein PA1088_02742 [Pseudomonas aeruginosa]AOX33171.1 hypothetical protein PA8281_06132 [Pseudomonas aeruginosa]
MPTENRSGNTYRHTFAATCPSDGDVIMYSLEIRSQTMIRVEHIKTATALIKHGKKGGQVDVDGYTRC